MKVGSGLEPDVELAPLINEQQKERVLSYVGVGTQEGAVVLTGGHELSGPGYERGNFLEPTVFDNMTPGMRIAQEEIFGPVPGIIAVSALEQAIEVANYTDSGLSRA